MTDTNSIKINPDCSFRYFAKDSLLEPGIVTSHKRKAMSNDIILAIYSCTRNAELILIIWNSLTNSRMHLLYSLEMCTFLLWMEHLWDIG